MRAERLGAIATGAVTGMLSVTVKPGLTDRLNGGTRGIDFFTALACIKAMSPWFTLMAREGMDSVSLSPMSLFLRLRGFGIQAEEEMLKATGGLSMYKGVFFSVALCAASAGRIISCMMHPDANTVCVVAAEMAQCLRERELETLDVKRKLIGSDSLSAGERMYLKYGAAGIRGEAESGFITVMKHAMPLIRKLRKENTAGRNDIYAQVFMTLLATTKDTGILTKENDVALEEMQDRARGILERGGVLTPLGREKLGKLDEHMRVRGIVPSGAGTLLAVAIFLNMLEEEDRHKFMA